MVTPHPKEAADAVGVPGETVLDWAAPTVELSGGVGQGVAVAVAELVALAVEAGLAATVAVLDALPLGTEVAVDVDAPGP